MGDNCLRAVHCLARRKQAVTYARPHGLRLGLAVGSSVVSGNFVMSTSEFGDSELRVQYTSN